MNRRHFLVTSAGALSASSAVFASPNDTLRVAVVGMGGRSPFDPKNPDKNMGRGGSHLSSWPKVPNAEIVALCDVDDAQVIKGLGALEKAGLKKPQVYKDFRKLLENKEIDVVSLATPNHWHTLQAIWAMQAGKDVYVEKPCSHNIFEAKQIVAAARKYDKMVQQGSQSRSSLALKEGVQKMRDGFLGDVYMARGLCIKARDTIGRASVEAPPATVDYDLWTGPSPMHPFTKNRFHYNWHWFWDTGNGDLGNQGIHEVDMARWGLGVKYPVKVSAMGGHFMFDDDQETPNTLSCNFEFNEGGKRKLMEFEVRHWYSNGEASVGPRPLSAAAAAAAAAAPPPPPASTADDGDSAPGAGRGAGRTRSMDAIGDIFYGSKGYLGVDSYQSYKTWMGKGQEVGPANRDAGEPTLAHFKNFAEAVRSRKRETLNAEIEEGAASTVLVHLANISFRLGRTINFDPATLSITGDAEAAKMMTRQYRKGFAVPEKV